MASSSNRSSRPNRFGMGFLSVLQISLLLFAVICLNYISSHNYTRVDYSRAADYSLSSWSVNYIKSEEISKRKRPVKLTMVFRRSSPIYERVRVLVEEYERQSGGKIELEVIDPIRAVDRAQQFAAAYNLKLIRDMILIDGRPTDDTPLTTESQTGTPALNPHITLALVEEMITYAVDEKDQRRPDKFRGEDLLTSRLVESIEGKPKTLLFLADKSRVDADGEDSPWNNLSKVLLYQNIQLKPENLAGLKEIPVDVNGVALIAPTYDFTDEEIATLEAYWSAPKAALLILLESGECPPKLKTFLRSKGLTPRKDRVITKEEMRVTTTVRGNFTSGISFLKGLEGQSAVFEGASSSIEVRENADDLMVRKLSPMPLIQVMDGYWGESDFGNQTGEISAGETYDSVRDNPLPLYIAAAVTRGAANDDRFAAETSRMVLISNTDFLQSNRQRAENMDFLAASSNWLVMRESLIGMLPRTIGTWKLPLLQAQVSFINRLNLIFAPLAFLLIGGLVYSSRRS
ncbi:MAG: Gldg family protein [Akkermansiaceae bacterium]